MYGRVTKYFNNRGYGFIRGEDGNSYFIHASKLYGEQLEKGYYVAFKSYSDDRSDYNAKNVSVIETPNIEQNQKKISHNKKNNKRKHKSCNADKIIRDDDKFQRFVKNFMKEQKLNSVNNL